MLLRLLVILIFLPMLLFAQPDTLWTRTYTNEIDNWQWVSSYSRLLETDDGGFLLAGGVPPQNGEMGDDSSDVWLLRVNSDGDSLWSVRYDTASVVHDAWQMANGDIMLVSGGPQIFLLRINLAGDTVWTRWIHHPDTTFGFWTVNAARTADDGIALWCCAEYCDAPGHWQSSSYLIKVSGDGDSLRTREFHYLGNNYANAIMLTLDGGFLLSGESFNEEGMTPDYWLEKTNSNGQSEWLAFAYAPWAFTVDNILAAADGGYLLLGYTPALHSYAVVRINSSGDYEWFQALDADLIKAVELAEGGYIVGYGDPYEIPPCHLTRLRTDGEILWDTSYDMEGAASASFDDFIQTADGGFALLSDETMWDPYRIAYRLVRLSSDPWIDASQTLAIEPAQYTLSPNYPNPFNPITSIPFSLSNTGLVRLEIFDINGRQVETLVNSTLPAGSHTIDWNAGSYSSGIYFARLQAGSFQACRKLVLLR